MLTIKVFNQQMKGYLACTEDRATHNPNTSYQLVSSPAKFLNLSVDGKFYRKQNTSHISVNLPHLTTLRKFLGTRCPANYMMFFWKLVMISYCLCCAYGPVRY